MSETPAWRRYLRLWGPDVRADVDDEIEFHVEMRAAELVAGGMDPAMARERALSEMGDVAGAKRACVAIDEAELRRRRWRERLETLGQDLRYTVRTLRRTPGLTLVAVLTLALGIGANTAIFSVLNAVLLRPLPFPAAGRLAAVWTSAPEGDQAISAVSFADFREWAAGSRAFSSMGAYTFERVTVTGGAEPALAVALGISSSLLPTLGVRPVLGRGFLPEDDHPGGAPHVLLAYGPWQRLFGGDPAIVGRTVHVDGAPFEVVGVLPRGFDFPPTLRLHDSWVSWSPGIYLPAGAIDEVSMPVGAFLVVGRLASGATPEQASAEIAGMLPEQARRSGAPVRRAHVESLRELVVAPLRPALLAFMAAVGMVLLIACVNVAAILLGRLSAREHELTLRAALGAGRRRILRQLLTESLVLATAGGALGVALAWAALRLLLAAAPADLPRVHAAGLDGRVLAFTLVVSLGAGLAFGLVPALRASRTDLRGALAAASRAVASERRTRRAHGLLVALQVGLAVALLAGAGLLLRSFTALAHVDLGVAADRLFTMDVSLPPDRYPGRTDAARFLEELDRRLAALPQVRAVSGIDRLPLGNSASKNWLRIVGRPTPRPGEAPTALNATAQPGYFQAMGIPLVRGRAFEESDDADAPRVAVISRSAAERYWPGADPVGASIHTFGRDWRVIGVVGDVHHFGPAAPPEPMMYFPYAQDITTRRDMTVVVRTAGDPAALAAPARAVVHELDPQLAVTNVRAFDALRSEKLAGNRFNALLVGAFAALALLLAAVGVYGIAAFAVARRTREIGVRVALGASRRRVVLAVLREQATMIGLGTAFGLAAAIPLMRLERGLLFGVAPTDPLTFTAVVALLLLVALLATYLPARRAARLDPTVALRAE